jgi:hypothetical protein
MDKIRPTDEYEGLFTKKKKEWKEIGFEVI